MGKIIAEQLLKVCFDNTELCKPGLTSACCFPRPADNCKVTRPSLNGGVGITYLDALNTGLYGLCVYHPCILASHLQTNKVFACSWNHIQFAVKISTVISIFKFHIVKPKFISLTKIFVSPLFFATGTTLLLETLCSFHRNTKLEGTPRVIESNPLCNSLSFCPDNKLVRRESGAGLGQGC